MQKIAIIGAAGVGKTYLLTENVIKLLRAEDPEVMGGKILVLTSSLHVADSIRAKLKEALSGNSVRDTGKMSATGAIVHTVRSICEETLKNSDPELQIMSDFRAWFILKECIRGGAMSMQSNFARVKDKRSFIRDMLELIEAASINSISIDQLPGTDQAADKLEDIKSIYRYYKGYCEQRNLVPPFEVIPRASGLLSEYGQQFKHLLIDQYEDLCPGEVQAVRLLSGDHCNVTIFADAVRCDLDSIPELWQDSKIEKLDDVHRQLTAKMAGHVNRLLGRSVYSEDDSHQALTIVEEETAIDEAEYIARTIRKERSQPGRKYADFAILCKEVKRLGRAIRDALKKHSIPYTGGADLSQDPLVQFVLLCLQVVAEPRNDDIVLKWLSSPIAQLDRADIYRAYSRRGSQDLLSTITRASGSVPLRAESGDRLEELLSILDFVRDKLRGGSNVCDLIVPILIRSGAMNADRMSAPPDDAGKMPALPDGEVTQAVMLFIEMIRDMETTYETKRRLAVILNDIRDGLTRISAPDKPIREDTDAVRIMSIQEARGLEFSVVFIPGMVSDLFPVRHPARQLLYGEDLSLTRGAFSGVDLPGTISPGRWREQEKQLFYIAMTRAKEKLYLTLAHQYPENENCEPSPFLADLLGGEELSADNCAHYDIIYQNCPVSNPPGELPSLDDIASDSELEIACYRYIRELERLDQQRAAEAIKRLSSTGLAGDLLPFAPLEEFTVATPSSGPFSHTSVRNFLSCPRRYFMAHLLRVETDYGPGALFGRLIHKVLAEFYKSNRKLCDHDLEKLWGEMREILFRLWNISAESEEPGGYEAGFVGNLLQAQSYLRLAEEVLHVYLQAEHSLWDEIRSCILTEENFSFSFGDYKLTGRIDRIDDCGLDGAEIIDFKTSLFDKDGESALKSKFLNVDGDPDYQPQDYQLPIYYLAGLDSPNWYPTKLIIYQLRNLSKRTGAPFRREIEILPDEDTRSDKKDKFITGADLELVKEDMLLTLDSMVSGTYPPEPRKDDVCERECKFSFLCDREID